MHHITSHHITSHHITHHTNMRVESVWMGERLGEGSAHRLSAYVRCTCADVLVCMWCAAVLERIKLSMARLMLMRMMCV